MRWEGLPEVPTVGEFIPGYEASSVFGLGAPKATPAEVIDRLNKEINAGLVDFSLKARLADLGGTVLAGLARRLRKADRGPPDETDKWAKVIRAAYIKPP